MEGLWYHFGGGWANADYMVWCGFDGTATLNTYGGSSYQLGPNESVDVEVGDLFDETGYVVNYGGQLNIADNPELVPGTEYVFRAKTIGDGGIAESAWTAELFATTDEEEEDCVFTQGFWKTHPEAWPVAGLTLGSVFYTNAQLLDIFNTPAEGNGLIFLAHQLIAAKLNIATGVPIVIPVVADAVADADALIGALVVPPVGAGYIAPADASGLTEILDQFNNGTLQGICTPTPVEASTWGKVKATFGN
jgi:hypothetical protein